MLQFLQGQNARNRVEGGHAPRRVPSAAGSGGTGRTARALPVFSVLGAPQLASPLAAEACPRCCPGREGSADRGSRRLPLPRPSPWRPCRRTRWARGPAALSAVFLVEEEKGKRVHSVSRPV